MAAGSSLIYRGASGNSLCNVLLSSSVADSFLLMLLSIVELIDLKIYGSCPVITTDDYCLLSAGSVSVAPLSRLLSRSLTLMVSSSSLLQLWLIIDWEKYIALCSIAGVSETLICLFATEEANCSSVRSAVFAGNFTEKLSKLRKAQLSIWDASLSWLKAD